MRLTAREIQTIKQAVTDIDPAARVYLYGSRVDDSKQGGDIDLFIISAKIDFEKKIQLRLRLYDGLGEQKIDLLVSEKPNTAFMQMILEQGIEL